MRKQRELENDSDVLIECRDVYKSFGEKHILKGVSFKVFLFLSFYIKKIQCETMFVSDLQKDGSSFRLLRGLSSVSTI